MLQERMNMMACNSFSRPCSENNFEKTVSLNLALKSRDPLTLKEATTLKIGVRISSGK